MIRVHLCPGLYITEKKHEQKAGTPRAVPALELGMGWLQCEGAEVG